MGQTAFSGHIVVKGTVIDARTGEPIPYATLRIGELPNYMKVVKALASDDKGLFEVKIPVGQYILRTSFVGYRTRLQPLMLQGNDATVVVEVPLEEGSVEMNEVEVKPLVSQSPTEIVYNLDQDPDRETSSLYDLIDRVPMVGRTPDGKVYIGDTESSFLIVRDGKKDALFGDADDLYDLTLKSLPAKAFSAVKIQLVPDKRYGGYTYVMSIESDEENNLFGVINQNLDEFKGHSSGSFNFYSNLLGSYNRFRFRAGGVLTQTRSPSSDTELTQDFFSTGAYLHQQAKSYRSGEGYVPRIVFSYDLGERHFLSGNLRFNYSKERGKNWLSNTQYDGNETYSYQTYTRESGLERSFAGELNYQYDFKKPKRILNVVYNFSHTPNEQGEYIRAEGEHVPSTPRQSGESRSEQHTLQAHYVDPLGKLWKLETGLSYLFRDYRTESLCWEGETLQTDERYAMDSRKYIFSNYLTFSFAGKEISTELSLNSEYLYDGKGSHIVRGEDNTEYISEKGFTFTPSFSVSYSPDKKLFLTWVQLRYDWKKSRPGLNMLSTYTNYSNPQSIRVGNPSLKSQDTHRLLLLLQTRSNTYISANTSLTRNKIASYWYNDDEGRVVNTYANAGKARSASLSVRQRFFQTSLIKPVMTVQGMYYYTSVNNQTSEQFLGVSSLAVPIQLKGIYLYPMCSYMYFHSNGTINNNYFEPFTLQCYASFKLFKGQLEVSINSGNLLRWNSKVKNEIITSNYRQYVQTRTLQWILEVKLAWKIGSFKVKPVKRAQRNAVVDDMLLDISDDLKGVLKE